MINAKVEMNINLPKLTFGDDLNYIAKSIIIPDIQNGIHRQMAIDGGRLPKNEPATLKRKTSNKSLIETGKLLSSLTYKMSGMNKVLISIKGNRKKIGGYLQIDGVGKKNKLYKFFGISKDANKRAMAYMNKKIKRLTSGK